MQIDIAKKDLLFLRSLVIIGRDFNKKLVKGNRNLMIPAHNVAVADKFIKRLNGAIRKRFK